MACHLVRSPACHRSTAGPWARSRCDGPREAGWCTLWKAVSTPYHTQWYVEGTTTLPPAHTPRVITSLHTPGYPPVW